VAVPYKSAVGVIGGTAPQRRCTSPSFRSGPASTVDLAWEDFANQLRYALFWYRGYKYWRAEPRLESCDGLYTISGRLVICLLPAEGFAPAGFANPPEEVSHVKS